jgi:hypothetical protein
MSESETKRLIMLSKQQNYLPLLSFNQFVEKLLPYSGDRNVEY